MSATQLHIDADDDVSERVERLEAIVDAYGLAETISALSIVCNEKAGHIQETWQDAGLARLWANFSNKLDAMAARAYEIGNGLSK